MGSADELAVLETGRRKTLVFLMVGLVNAVETPGDPLAQSKQYTPRQLKHRISTPTGHADLVDLVKQEDSRRHEAIRMDIAARLRNACSYMSDEEFSMLVEKMVKTQFGGERRRIG